ncbi:uncharacterized protein LAESUDRAFT_728319, partial [Laetiporus sulphureus 93-53]
MPFRYSGGSGLGLAYACCVDMSDWQLASGHVSGGGLLPRSSVSGGWARRQIYCHS